jgi:hypothetical protein
MGVGSVLGVDHSEHFGRGIFTHPVTLAEVQIGEDPHENVAASRRSLASKRRRCERSITFAAG